MQDVLAWVATIVGTLASITSLVVACIQAARIRELRRHTEADTWEGIRMLRSAVRILEGSEAVKKGDPKATEARGKLVESIRHFIKQAALAERHFDEHTINAWKALGRIEGDWHEAAARMHLPAHKSVNPTTPK